MLDEAVDRLEAVEPPQEATGLRDDLVASWTALTDLIESADLTDPSADADLAGEATRLQGDPVSAGEAVDEHGQENC